MKLSEVIKAIEDGSKSEFISSVDRMMYKLKSDKFGFIRIYMNGGSQSDLQNNCDWEEVKPPRQWSEKELMLFKLLPDWAKWISKDETTGYIFLWEDKPMKMELYKEFNANEKPGTKLNYLSDLFNFLTITFEESPIYIGDLKGE